MNDKYIVCEMCEGRMPKRLCPEKGNLCPECCVENRIYRIPCSEDCAYLSKEEDLCREIYRETKNIRAELSSPLARQCRGWQEYLSQLEVCIFGYYSQKSLGFDDKVILTAAKQYRKFVSPVVEMQSDRRTLLTGYIIERMKEYSPRQWDDSKGVGDIVDVWMELIEKISSKETPRRYLRSVAGLGRKIIEENKNKGRKEK